MSTAMPVTGEEEAEGSTPGYILDKTVGVMVTADEKKRVRLAAAAKGQTMSAWGRDALMRAAGRVLSRDG